MENKIKTRCPKCNKVIKGVNIISECWQRAKLAGIIIGVVGEIEEITEMKKIECPKCFEDISETIKFIGTNECPNCGDTHTNCVCKKCDICNDFQDENGRCGCTNNN